MLRESSLLARLLAYEASADSQMQVGDDRRKHTVTMVISVSDLELLIRLLCANEVRQ